MLRAGVSKSTEHVQGKVVTRRAGDCAAQLGAGCLGLARVAAVSVWRSWLLVQRGSRRWASFADQRRHDGRYAVSLCVLASKVLRRELIKLVWREIDLTVDVRDAVGDRLHVSDEFTKDGVRY